MILRKIFPIASDRGSRGGFTLVEIIVVMGLVMLIFGIGSYFAFDNFQRYLFRKERDTAIAVLMKARSRAMNNFYEKSHGVHIGSDTFTLFRGLNYGDDPSTYEVIPGTAAISKSGATDIVFEQLSGRPASAGNLMLSYGASNITISINEEGRIDW